MQRIILTAAALAMTPAMLTIPAGCASTSAPNRLASTTGTMSDIETLLREGEAELDQLIASMDALQEAPDLKRAYRDFDGNIDDIERISERVRARRITMQTRASEYVARWDSESSGLRNERAAEISEDRRAQFRDSVDSVTEELDQLRADYDPFISKLRDLRVVLTNDLTTRGVELTEPIRDDVRAMAEDLRGRSADAQEALESARAEFARPTLSDDDTANASS